MAYLIAGILLLVPESAAAHGEYGTGVTVSVGPMAAVAGVTIGGGIVGVGATRRRFSVHDGPTSRIDRFVGPLLVVLGLLAIAIGVTRAVLPAFGGAAVGAIIAVAVRHGGNRQTCAEATVGVIGVHRVIEGIAIAAFAAAQATIGIVSATLVAVHACMECIAIGSHPDLDRKGAIRSVLAVQTAFLGGVVLGVIVFNAVDVDAPWLTAGVGSVLAVFGAGITVEGV